MTGGRRIGTISARAKGVALAAPQLWFSSWVLASSFLAGGGATTGGGGGGEAQAATPARTTHETKMRRILDMVLPISAEGGSFRGST